MAKLSKYKKIIICSEFDANTFLEQGQELIKVVVTEDCQQESIIKYTPSGSAYTEYYPKVTRQPRFILGLTEMGRTLYDK